MNFVIGLLEFWSNWVASAGRYSRLEAKMTGMTPAWLTLSGMYVEEPPYILRPTIRRAYWTGIRRWPCSMKMTVAMMTRPMATTMKKTAQPLLSLSAHIVAG